MSLSAVLLFFEFDEPFHINLGDIPIFEHLIDVLSDKLDRFFEVLEYKFEYLWHRLSDFVKVFFGVVHLLQKKEFAHF